MMDKEIRDIDLCVINLPLRKVKDNPFQPRKRYPRKGIRTLANNIYDRGLIQPVSVVRVGEGEKEHFILVAGHRRLRAFKMLRRKTIPAIIRKKSTREDLALDLAVENALRKDFTPIEKAQSVLQVLSTLKAVGNNPVYAYSLVGQLKLWETRGKAPCTQGICASFNDDDIFECRKLLNLINLSSTRAQQYLRLLDLPDILKDRIISSSNQNEAMRMMREGYINVAQAYELTRVKDNELRLKIYHKMIEEKWRFIQLKYILDELIERGMAGNNASGLGSCRAKLDKSDKMLRLSKSCFRLSSTIHNSKNMISRMEYSVDKAALRASITKLKKDCLRLAEECSNVLRVDDGMELVNAELEFTLRKAKTKSKWERRMSFPVLLTKKMKLSPGDRLMAKIVGVIRATPAGDYEPEGDDFEEALEELSS